MISPTMAHRGTIWIQNSILTVNCKQIQLPTLKTPIKDIQMW